MLLKAERKINGGHEILWYAHMNQSKSFLFIKNVIKKIHCMGLFSNSLPF